MCLITTKIKHDWQVGSGPRKQKTLGIQVKPPGTNCPVQFQHNCNLVVNTEKHCMASFSSPSQHLTIDLFQITHLYRKFPLTELQGRFLPYSGKFVIILHWGCGCLWTPVCEFAHENAEKKKLNTRKMHLPPTSITYLGKTNFCYGQ